MKPFAIRLAAHQFIRTADGHIQTVLLGARPIVDVTVDSFEAAEREMVAFGSLHAPCNLWVGVVSHPAPRGFDQWQRQFGAENLFEAPQ